MTASTAVAASPASEVSAGSQVPSRSSRGIQMNAPAYAGPMVDTQLRRPTIGPTRAAWRIGGSSPAWGAEVWVWFDTLDRGPSGGSRTLPGRARPTVVPGDRTEPFAPGATR